MKFKQIEELGIAECCDVLQIPVHELPDALERVLCYSEVEAMTLERLQYLLSEDRAAYEACATISDYDAYLTSWPEGLWRSHVEQLMVEQLSAAEYDYFMESKETIEGCDRYLRFFPNGVYADDVRVIRARLEDGHTFELCQNADDYRSYLAKFPNGYHVREAKKLIRKFDREEERKLKQLEKENRKRKTDCSDSVDLHDSTVNFFVKSGTVIFKIFLTLIVIAVLVIAFIYIDDIVGGLTFPWLRFLFMVPCYFLLKLIWGE